jgi:protocatechuate 3,4-dioxygenase beta subunit
LTPRTAEGPFYSNAVIERADISEARPGVPLELALDIVEVEGCRPLVDARVDVWHADAAGCYSGFQGQGDERDLSTVGQTFLRGTQHADTSGRVRFTTVYPGWYAGRTPHINVKVFANEAKPFCGQIYFPEDLSAFIFARLRPYNRRRRPRDTFNRDDRVFLSSRGDQDSICAVTAANRGLVAALTIGVGAEPKPKAGRQTPSGAARRRRDEPASRCQDPIPPEFGI